ncbi:hypothetical protein ACRAR1_16525 [Streptomyces sanyensis]|uniref:hypothetical protein n=1 Tax=Streptomyces sanyensis TaxID=568869 RepID=UPI003D78141F
MTNHEHDPETASGTAASPVSAPGEDGAPAQGPGPAARPPGRRRLVAALPALLVVGALLAGGGATAAVVAGADTQAPTAVWSEAGEVEGSDDPAAGAVRGRTDSELSRALLPVPDNYRLGPDMDEYGNDVMLSAKEATAVLKSNLDGLSGKPRREAERQVDELGVQGIAMRSYQKASDDLAVEIIVGEIEDEGAARRWYRLRKGLLQEYGHKGPAIPGHRDAFCASLPGGDAEGETELATIDCSAYKGGFMVTVSAYGRDPLDVKTVAGLLKDQLDHIASPGEYV